MYVLQRKEFVSNIYCIFVCLCDGPSPLFPLRPFPPPPPPKKMYREESDSWVLEEKLDSHTDWVRDVAWCPSIGLPISRIASCSQVSWKSPMLSVNFFVVQMKTTGFVQKFTISN